MNFLSIKDLNDPELDFFSKYSEVQLFRMNEPDPGVFVAESANVVIRALEAGYEPLKLLVEDERIETEAAPVFEAIARLYGKELLDSIPVFTAKREIVTALTGYKLVRGLWAVFKRRALTDLGSFLKERSRITLLYDVVNPTNVGAIIRSAAALGMDGALLTRPSVDPLTRRSARVSMGTVFQLPWTRVQKNGPEGSELIEFLHNEGFTTAAMALTKDTISIDDPALKAASKLAVVLGTEGTGLPDEVISACSFSVKIPMHHGVDSLNVAAASAVCFYELLK